VALAYREHPPPADLRPIVACLWEQEPAEPHVQRVVPDGCVDLIWLCERELVVAGADTGPHIVELAAATRSSGIRIRPGGSGAVLGLPASEVCDLRVAASSLWGPGMDRVQAALADAVSSRRLDLLAAFVRSRHAEPDPLATDAARALAAPRATVADVAAFLGISERQLHRRMRAAVGYGPKMLARVGRLRRLVAADDEPLAMRALDAGYASQAHMNDEVRRLTGLTPVRFLADGALTAA
jgi:AraC-like DNA-binding protein